MRKTQKQYAKETGLLVDLVTPASKPWIIEEYLYVPTDDLPPIDPEIYRMVEERRRRQIEAR